MTHKISNYVSDSNLRASPAGYSKIERTCRTPTTASTPEYNTVDHTSNVRVSSNKLSIVSRRDSWDVINKTKHLLSHNSLESLKNLTENQLNTNSISNRKHFDPETQLNTHFNQYTTNSIHKIEKSRLSTNKINHEKHTSDHCALDNVDSLYR